MLFADLQEMLESIPGILTVTFIFGGWIIVAVVGSITKNWRKVHESEHLAALKQSMIERGMSVDAIERVLRAGPTSFDESAIDEATELSKVMAEHGVPAPAMEKILGAYRNAVAGERKTISKTVVAMLKGGAGGEQVLAVVRALTRPASPEATQERRFPDSATSFRE